MIHMHNHRIQGHGTGYAVEHDQSMDEAVTSLIQYELGYGGRVTEITDDRVRVVTPVLACIDTVTWTGTPKEMEPLIRIAASWLLLVNEGGRQRIVEAIAGPLVERTGGKALLVAAIGPIAVGKALAKQATAVALAEDEDDVKRLMDLPFTDLVPLYAMCAQDGMSFKDAAAVLLTD